MKKNKMMRLASFLLIAVLVSTSAISGTYAKYTTEGFVEDSARVAKWGVKVTGTVGTANDMFKATYDETGSVTVDAGATDVVAPGTTGKLSAFDVSGQPEVDVQVKYEAVVTLSANWAYGGAYYCPLIVTVAHNGTWTTIDGLECSSVADFASKIKDAIDGATANYDAGTNLADVEDDLSITWWWPIDKDAAGANEDQDDAKDTYLGDLGTAPSIFVNVTCTITQVD